MSDLTFSVIGQTTNALAAAVAAFEAEHRVKVDVEVLDWATARSQLVDFALFKTGPDVSEVGSTWLSSFRAMNAIRAFKMNEMAQFGGQKAYLAAAWQGVIRHEKVWAIPWMSDTRTIFYRKDVLQNLGIDAAGAFATVESLRATLSQISAQLEIPAIALPTAKDQPSFHLAAPWVWYHNGHFLRADGRQTRFTEPDTLAGLTDYFQTMLPHIAAPLQGLSDFHTTQRFLAGEAAITISGHWLLSSLRAGEGLSGMADKVALAMLPVPPFVGGTGLVVWQHSRKQRLAVQLAQHLAAVNVQHAYVRELGFMPTLETVFRDEPFLSDPGYQVMAQSLRRGQSFTATYLWGLVEDKLTAALAHIWRKLFADPDQDVAELVENTLRPLARQLDRTLSDR